MFDDGVVGGAGKSARHGELRQVDDEGDEEAESDLDLDLEPYHDDI